MRGILERTQQAHCSWRVDRGDPAGCKALGNSERLSQGYLLFLWKILSFSLAWGPPLCLDTEYLCFLGEKSATTLHFGGAYCETKHRPPRVLGICYTQSLWAGSAGNAGAMCWQLALSPVCGSPDILQRHSCRSSSEIPTSVASSSWITVRHLTS